MERISLKQETVGDSLPRLSRNLREDMLSVYDFMNRLDKHCPEVCTESCSIWIPRNRAPSNLPSAKSDWRKKYVCSCIDSEL